MQKATLPQFQLEPNGRWFEQIPLRLSPFQNARPANVDVDTLVIHNISLPPAVFGADYIEQLFLGCVQVDAPILEDVRGLKVSSHLLIRRCGEVIQYVPFDRRAWHAGVSELHGRTNCNDFSIGIELEGTDELPYSSSQYRSLVGVTLSLLEAYPRMTVDRICGHNQIAPGRKTDPGPAFDWAYYRQQLSKAS